MNCLELKYEELVTNKNHDILCEQLDSRIINSLCAAFMHNFTGYFCNVYASKKPVFRILILIQRIHN